MGRNEYSHEKSHASNESSSALEYLVSEDGSITAVVELVVRRARPVALTHLADSDAAGLTRRNALIYLRHARALFEVEQPQAIATLGSRIAAYAAPLTPRHRWRGRSLRRGRQRRRRRRRMHRRARHAHVEVELYP